MTLRKLQLLLLAVCALCAGKIVHAQDAAAKPFLHPLFTDNMVLQRGIAAPVWGWAAPGQDITVSLNKKKATTRADASGKWLAKIGPLKAGGPYTLTVAGPQTVTLKNVLIGDVWICSGQSNMEMGIGISKDGPAEIAAANYPNIRLFTVPKLPALEPSETVAGNWQPCTPATVGAGGWGGFSAAAYYFGRELHQRTGIPIGLIHTSWGGTIAEAWTSGTALKAMPDFAPAVAQVEQLAAKQKAGAVSYEQAVAAWWTKNDPGSKAAPGWEAADLDAADWKTMSLPQPFEKSDLGNFDGLVWFRRELELPADWAGRAANLYLGPIDDRDTTWVNGVQVGTSDNWQAQRDYKIPAGVLKAGRNVITVRILDTGGGGGMYGNPDQLKLTADGTAALSLAGDWQYRVGGALAALEPFPMPINGNPNVVTVLYNGMIAPLLPYGIKGAIWYQGESNAGRPKQYRTLLPTMVKDWRARFGVGDFPFYIVQLANYTPVLPQPSESQWAELREAQSLTAQTVPHSGLAVAIDIGEAGDIHPKNKQEVGRRLALNALAKDYGQKVEYSGPAYRAMQIKGNEIRLTFDHADGLAAKGDKLQGFAIAGVDKKWVWADARIEGKTVIVSSPAVPAPVAVRYAWATNPVANLYNRAGLPASPFRTDID